MKQSLVESAIRGDKQALEKLLKENYQQLYKTAFLYVKQEVDALDIVQESVVKIMRRIQTLTYPEYFTTWCVRIVIYTALDYLKRENQLVDYSETLSSEVGLSREEELDIYEAIRRLPQHLQEITILHYFYGKKLRELSAVLDEPLGTIKYKLHEARRLLKDYLEEDAQ